MEGFQCRRPSPTDEELLSFYLKKKIAGEDAEFSYLFPETNVCEHEPRYLPEYFFSKPNYMNTNSNRCFRTTGEGYYKSTGRVRKVKAKLSQAVIGNKRILPFWEGHAPKGKITKYEFSLPKTKQAQLGPNPNQQREFILNHLTTKSVNYKKRRYDSICDKLAEPGIASNYKDDQAAAAAANMILKPEEHLADKDVLFGSKKRNEGAESESANGSRLIENNDISTLDVGLSGGYFSCDSDILAVNDLFHEASFQPERNLISPMYTGLLGDVVCANNSIPIGMQ